MVDNNKLSKEAKTTLNSALKVLEYSMEIAAEKQDLDAMIAISDRLMALYQHLADQGAKKFKMGFGIMDSGLGKQSKSEAEQDDDESD